MKKTYFMDIRFKGGEFVTVVYESAHRKNSWDHYFDLCRALERSGLKQDVDWTYKYNKDTAQFAYILNKKNAYEQCFGDHKTIELA